MKTKSYKILRTLLIVAADVLCVFAAAVLAVWMTTGAFTLNLPVVLWVAANAALAVVLFALLKTYSIVLVAANIIDLMRIGLAMGAVLLCNVIFGAVFGHQYGIGIAAAIVYSLLLFVCVCLIRFAKRALHVLVGRAHNQHAGKKRVLVVGAGEAGAMLITEMMTSQRVSYIPVCIVDDNKALHGQTICEITVAGGTDKLAEYARKYAVDEIFVAMPSVSKRTVSKILEKCRQCGCPVKVLPGIYQLANGQVSVSKLRKVEITDLLGREQVRVNLDEIMGYIEQKVVLVTGGGGSIGSELCRQIASHNPKQLIILDIYENNAYDIEQELKRKLPNCNLLTLIASVRDERKIRDVFEKYRPQIVFNAAAHKHVPLMETSPNEAVKNNVFGTLNVAKASDEYGVETFVQISTDKAVNPTNIMGATKRICEMIIQTIGKRSKNTKFVAVRFGNVLGSNGSVIPLFKRQIEEGGPVTLTHKDIIRYFMTIPEAVSLVLQAGAYAKGGEIFVLDMGEPVKIYDLAYNLIKLSGLEPEVDIQIVCTGLRPGEKLFEERLMEEEGLQKTANGSISIAKPIPLNEE